MTRAKKKRKKEKVSERRNKTRLVHSRSGKESAKGCERVKRGKRVLNRRSQSRARRFRSRVPCPAARFVLEERVADHRLRRVLMSNVVLHVELLFAKLAAIGALETRRFAAVVLVMSRYGALRGVTLAAARTRVAGPRLPQAPAAGTRILGPRQRQHLKKR